MPNSVQDLLSCFIPFRTDHGSNVIAIYAEMWESRSLFSGAIIETEKGVS